MKGASTRYVAVRLKRIDLDRAGRPVLRDIEWTLRPGERWVLAGGNGAGKTQLLKLVSGAVWPTPTGRESRIYTWQGEEHATPADVKDEIAYVGAERQDRYERYGWNHTVTQIVGTGLYRTDIPLDPLTPADRKQIESLLKRLGIGHLAKRGFLSLSYGERRLTLLARALASRPKLLLLDELLNGLDEINRARARKWLESTGRSHLPWVLATHRAEDVPSCATHALILDEGRVAYRGALARAPLAKWLEHDAPAKEGPGAAHTSHAIGRASRSHVRARAGKPIVRLENAAVYLEDRKIIEGLSFEVHPGECWVVHGSNGSGKTTLLRTLYGDFGVAVGGRIERAGIEPGVPLEHFKRRAGFVAAHLQADHPHELTVAEIVQSGRHASIGLNDAPTAADRAAARRALELFDLAGFGARTRVELSYGQMRRVLFARAWVARPKLLLLDEPLAGVDAPTRRVLLQRIGQLVAGGTAVVMTTHHREEWPPYATHELELAGGKARYLGSIRLGKRRA
ncbi:MAG TPA: ATP-binding cassette domain-containing protein [Steroidobacteraceae bacterium]|nr:ATP-binding cassette domain-containing protein [Steroidobacteraceae bacterium]